MLYVEIKFILDTLVEAAVDVLGVSGRQTGNAKMEVSFSGACPREVMFVSRGHLDPRTVSGVFLNAFQSVRDAVGRRWEGNLKQ